MVHFMFGAMALFIAVATVFYVRDKLAEKQRANKSHLEMRKVDEERQKREVERHASELALNESIIAFNRCGVACREADELRLQWIHERRVEKEERGFE